MRWQISLVAAVLLGTAALTGCGSSGLFGSWGELGDEISAGPYRFQPPKQFKQEPQKVSAPGETKVMFRGPTFGKSEPGIVFSYGAHHQDFTSQEPNWTEAVRMGLMGLRTNSSNFTHNTGPPTTINGLPGVRVQFKGKLTVKSQSREMEGVGYLLIDNSNLLFAIGMDFGPNAASSIPKLEESLKTIKRPGFSMPAGSWANRGSSSSNGALAANSSRPGSSGPGSSGPGSSYPGSSGPGSSYPGSSYPGSSGPGSSGPGSSGPGSSGPGSSYPGSSGPGSSYPGSGYPGSSRSGSSYPGSNMGSRPGPGTSRPGGYPGMGSGMSGPGRGSYSSSGPRGSSGPGSNPYGRSGPPGSSGPGSNPYGSGYPGSNPASGGAARVVDQAELQRKAQAAQRAAELAVTAADSANPDYFSANLEVLQVGNDAQKSDVLKRLADCNPSDISDGNLRKELARALRDTAEDTQAGVTTRRQAIPVLVAWTSSYSVPILIGLLEDKQRFIQMDALDQLTILEDDRAIEPVTDLFVQNAILRDKAGDCLRTFGTAAEDKVLEKASPIDPIITRAAVQLLGDIGTDKSVDAMGQLRKLRFYSVLKKDINEAVAKIRKRSNESK